MITTPPGNNRHQKQWHAKCNWIDEETRLGSAATHERTRHTLLTTRTTILYTLLPLSTLVITLYTLLTLRFLPLSTGNWLYYHSTLYWLYPILPLSTLNWLYPLLPLSTRYWLYYHSLHSTDSKLDAVKILTPLHTLDQAFVKKIQDA